MPNTSRIRFLDAVVWKMPVKKSSISATNVPVKRMYPVDWIYTTPLNDNNPYAPRERQSLEEALFDIWKKKQSKQQQQNDRMREFLTNNALDPNEAVNSDRNLCNESKLTELFDRQVEILTQMHGFLVGRKKPIDSATTETLASVVNSIKQSLEKTKRFIVRGSTELMKDDDEEISSPNFHWNIWFAPAQANDDLDKTLYELQALENSSAENTTIPAIDQFEEELSDGIKVSPLPASIAPAAEVKMLPPPAPKTPKPSILSMVTMKTPSVQSSAKGAAEQQADPITVRKIVPSKPVMLSVRTEQLIDLDFVPEVVVPPQPTPRRRQSLISPTKLQQLITEAERKSLSSLQPSTAVHWPSFCVFDEDAVSPSALPASAQKPISVSIDAVKHATAVAAELTPVPSKNPTTAVAICSSSQQSPSSSSLLADEQPPSSFLLSSTESIGSPPMQAAANNKEVCAPLLNLLEDSFIQLDLEIETHDAVELPTSSKTLLADELQQPASSTTNSVAVLHATAASTGFKSRLSNRHRISNVFQNSNTAAARRISTTVIKDYSTFTTGLASNGVVASTPMKNNSTIAEEDSQFDDDEQPPPPPTRPPRISSYFGAPIATRPLSPIRETSILQNTVLLHATNNRQTRILPVSMPNRAATRKSSGNMYNLCFTSPCKVVAVEQPPNFAEIEQIRSDFQESLDPFDAEQLKQWQLRIMPQVSEQTVIPIVRTTTSTTLASKKATKSSPYKQFFDAVNEIKPIQFPGDENDDRMYILDTPEIARSEASLVYRLLNLNNSSSGDEQTEFVAKIILRPLEYRWWELYINVEIQTRLQQSDDEFLNFFALARLAHELPDPTRGYVMCIPYSSGGTLSHVLHAFTHYVVTPQLLALKYAIDLMRAVSALHAINIIHADLSPDNVLCCNRAAIDQLINNESESDGDYEQVIRQFIRLPTLKICDFSRSIDLNLLAPTSAKLHNLSEQRFANKSLYQELLLHRSTPCTFELDLVGLLSTIHKILFAGKEVEFSWGNDDGNGRKVPIFHCFQKAANSSGKNSNVLDPIWSEMFAALLQAVVVDEEEDKVTRFDLNFWLERLERVATELLMQNGPEELLLLLMLLFFESINKQQLPSSSGDGGQQDRNRASKQSKILANRRKTMGF